MLRERHRVRNGMIVATVALAVIAVPLVATGIDRSLNAIRADSGAPVVRSWIGSRDLNVSDWSVNGADVKLTLTGPDVPAPAEDLATSLASTFGIPVALDLRYVPSTHSVTDAAP
jgi:hypothetical protein